MMANQMTSTFVISEGHCKAMGSGVSGPARAETTEKTSEGVWPFSSLADVMEQSLVECLVPRELAGMGAEQQEDHGI